MVATITPIDTEALKMLYFEMIADEPNIFPLLNSEITGISIENGVIQSIKISGRYGEKTISGKVFIDATGDGDIMSLAKERYDVGRDQDGFSQPMSLMFKVKGIDLKAVRNYIKENKEQFVWDNECSVDDYLAVAGFFSLVKKAQQNGDLTIPRDRVLFFQGLSEDEAIVNMTRVIKLSGLDSEDLTKAEFEAHAQVDEILRFFRKYIPGFENCVLKAVGNTVGVRESRRLSGEFKLTADDVLDNKEFPDSVAICAFPIDIHSPTGQELNWVQKEKFGCFDIPYKVMLPQNTKNLLVTGRCISATHEALASARISATAMALGQAAGLACAMSVKGDVALHDLNVADLQDNLYKHGAIPGKKWIKV
jgi:hypothetical protein